MIHMAGFIMLLNIIIAVILIIVIFTTVLVIIIMLLSLSLGRSVSKKRLARLAGQTHCVPGASGAVLLYIRYCKKWTLRRAAPPRSARMPAKGEVVTNWG